MAQVTKSALLASQDQGVSKQLSLTHLLSPTVFALQDGQIGSVLQCEGVPFDTASNETLNSYHRMLHHAVCLLGEGFCLYAHTVRKKAHVRLEGTFPPGFLKDVDDAYHRRFKEKALYTNQLYLTVLYKGMTLKGGSGVGMGIDLGLHKWPGLRFLKSIRYSYVKNVQNEARHLSVGTLNKHVQQLLAQLSVFKPRRLGEHDEEAGHSELMSFFGLFVNGLEQRPYRFTSQVPPMAVLPFKPGSSFTKTSINKKLVRFPHGNLAPYLPRKRLFFGKDTMEFQSGGDKPLFAVILSLKTYSSDTAPILLDTLLQLDAEFLSTHTFVPLPEGAAQGKVVKQLIRMENANDPAISLKLQLAQCRDDVASGRAALGFHHNTVMLIGDNREKLQAQVNFAMKYYADAAMVAIQETLGLEAAFWAQMPGHQRYIVRANLITSHNFVDFCPLHNHKTKQDHKSHLGSAVTLIETPSNTPLFFHFHAKGSGSQNDLTPGHTTLIGGNGSGKTVLMGFMDAQMTRFGGRSVFFDRDRGLDIYVRATGGRYIIISPDHPEDCRFNPFSLDDTPSNRAFLIQWLSQLIKEEDETTLSADIAIQLAGCVDYAYEQLEKSQRNLYSATRLLPVDFPRWHRLHAWLRADNHRNSGEHAYLFDNDTDSLSLNTAKTGIDLTVLLNQPKHVLTVVCMYIMHRIKQSLDGKSVSIYFDEGWQVLNNDYWKRQLKEDLPTLRKHNAYIVLATQSPDSVINSALSAEFLDNAATNLFFCNPRANYEKHYQHFGLTRSEFEFIQQTPPEKRLFLYKQGHDSVIGKPNLTGLEDQMAVWSGNKATVQLVERLRKELGENPEQWLPAFYAARKQTEEGAT